MNPAAWLTNGKLALVAASLVVGIGIGAVLALAVHRHGITEDIHDFANTYHFISPLLACSGDLDIEIDEARSLENAVQNSIDVHENSGDVSEVSVYYRDLNNGPRMGINTKATFPPGSLLKVPLAMTVYKLAEADQTILSKKLMYTGAEVPDEQFFEPLPFAAGEHTVTELVHQMLVNSDNNAANVLANAVGVDSFESTYRHLGLPEPPATGTDYEITTSQFASFFRTLYSATYLDDDGSEKLLELMSESAFTEGLVAGVPTDIVVSHKFGERAFSNNLTKELHDCGIIYVPQHPYLLCVMTKGGDFEKQAKVIAEISRIAYTFTTGSQ